MGYERAMFDETFENNKKRDTGEMMNRDFLTAREVEILGLAAGGKSDREISIALNLSTHTINTHFRNIFKKLSAHNRVHAVAKAMTAGLITLKE